MGIIKTGAMIIPMAHHIQSTGQNRRGTVSAYGVRYSVRCSVREKSKYTLYRTLHMRKKTVPSLFAPRTARHLLSHRVKNCNILQCNHDGLSSVLCMLDYRQGKIRFHISSAFCPFSSTTTENNTKLQSTGYFPIQPQ